MNEQSAENRKIEKKRTRQDKQENRDDPQSLANSKSLKLSQKQSLSGQNQQRSANKNRSDSNTRGGTLLGKTLSLRQSNVDPSKTEVTVYKLGFSEKIKILYYQIEARIKTCLESIIAKLYPARQGGAYEREVHSMKNFPLENIGMCLDEYLYRFERIDNNQEFLQKEIEDDDGSDDEREQMHEQKLRERDLYAQFWQWNYMVIDTDTIRDAHKQAGEGEEEEDDDDDNDNDDQPSDEEDDDIRNQFKVPDILNTKLKEAKKEYSALRKEVKNANKTYRTNLKEMESIHMEQAKLTIEYDQYQQQFTNACDQNQVLRKAQMNIFAVKDSMNHIKLRNY